MYEATSVNNVWPSRVSRWIASLAVLLLISLAHAEVSSTAPPVGPATRPEKTVRIMAVGNSFSRDALMNVSDLAEAAGNQLIAANAIILGGSMQDHVRGIDSFEAGGPAHIARPYGGKSLRDMLAAEPWDIVTIQQASKLSIQPESFEPYAKRLIEYIHRYAPQAEVVIHQTWAYRDDNLFWGRDDYNTDRMYADLRRAYDDLARRYGLRQIPSGDAMQAARLDPAWGQFIPDPDFDAANAAHPALPEHEKHSLNRNFFWIKDNKTGQYKLVRDGMHANSNGHYLLACVWYEFLFKENVLDNPYKSPWITPEDAAILRRIAHEVVMEKHRPAISALP